MIKKLADMGINATPAIEPYSKKPKPFYQNEGWASSDIPSASIDTVFGTRAEFANRIIKSGGMKECSKASQYVNLSFNEKKNIAQIHPQKNGIAFVLKSKKKGKPETYFPEIPVSSLTGCKRTNEAWLKGVRNFEKKGPAIAFLIPDEVFELADDSKEWKDVKALVEYAKTLL
jgi:hypothetical protein